MPLGLISLFWVAAHRRLIFWWDRINTTHCSHTHSHTHACGWDHLHLSLHGELGESRWGSDSFSPLDRVVSLAPLLVFEAHVRKPMWVAHRGGVLALCGVLALFLVLTISYCLSTTQDWQQMLQVHFNQLGKYKVLLELLALFFKLKPTVLRLNQGIPLAGLYPRLCLLKQAQSLFSVLICD